MLTDEQINEIKSIEDRSNKHFFQVLIDGNYLDTEILKDLIEFYYKIDFCDVLEKQFSEKLLNKFKYEFIAKHNFMPIEYKNGELIVAMSNPFDMNAIDEMELIMECDIKPVFADYRAIKIVIDLNYSSSKINSIQSQFIDEENLDDVKESKKENDDIKNSPIVKFVDSIIDSAILFNASDIHIEPYENMLRIRFRIDGELTTHKILDIKLLSNIVSRIKIISNMDISIRRLPQDGHFRLTKDDSRMDFRISTMPTIFGEKVVLRIIYSSKYIINKSNLGFFDKDLKTIDDLLKNPHGTILVTGPTGCGKTTTLVSLIADLNKENINIVTAEDPIENIISGVNQIHIHTKIGLKFSTVLRSLLRQDPDVIMIGEIRDDETAKIAIRASITGHLVLSTLHTNDAISSIVRLIDMGVEPYLIPATLRVVISQRLVRKICDKCKVETNISEKDIISLNLEADMKVFKGKGCSHCNFTGYSGRFAVYEILSVDYKMKDIISSGNINAIRKYCIEKGMVTLRENVISNIKLGNTTIEEMYKVVYGGDI